MAEFASHEGHSLPVPLQNFPILQIGKNLKVQRNRLHEAIITRYPTTSSCFFVSVLPLVPKDNVVSQFTGVKEIRGYIRRKNMLLICWQIGFHCHVSMAEPQGIREEQQLLFSLIYTKPVRLIIMWFWNTYTWYSHRIIRRHANKMSFYKIRVSAYPYFKSSNQFNL